MPSRLMKTALFGVALAAFAQPAVLAARAAQPAAATGDRATTALADGWRFKLDPARSGPERPGFDDAGWSQVSVPHTWNRVGYYLDKASEHLNTAQNVDKTMGVGWYRLAFRPVPTAAGKRTWLEFDAASRIAEVWLNGVRLGEHTGGFSRFRFDATNALKPGQPNVLAVRVDNAKPEPGSSTADVLPLAGDFFVHGGLYRPVRLITTDPVHFDLLDHGGSGIRATSTLTNGAAIVHVRSGLHNDGNTVMPLRIEARLVDASGRVAARALHAVEVPANGAAGVAQDIRLAAPHLWNGVPDPYLYSLVVEARGAGGRVLDRVSQPYGIREMRFDAARGFILNGKPYPLHGVGYHQDREGKGWAISAADTAADLAIMREMGVNTIRLTHYQHGQPVHDLADKYGLVVWDEIPLVSQWTLGGAPLASPGLLANARQQLAELVAQDGNHASVGMWSIANEVDFGNSLPAFLTGSKGPPPDPAPILTELNQLAHELDPSRPTALATCCEGRLFEPGVEVPITSVHADLAGANRYFGWYFGESADLGPALDALHATRPNQPLAVTEYGGGGAVTLHTDDPDATPPDSRGRRQPEEVESMIHERNWSILAKKPYLYATWLWSAFDFASTVRREGDANDINTKGLVTYDRKIRKDAYYFYKANWSATPTVYVTGRRYLERAYPVTDVRVYSNAGATTLQVNGKALATLSNCPDRVCVWKAVRLAPGANRIEAVGRFASGPVRDRITWNLAPGAERNIRIDAGALIAGASADGRFGSDAFFTGGTAGSVDKPADYGKPAQPAAIADTQRRDVAATYRSGNFAYHIPVGPGRYTVRLTFVEPSAAPGERVFDVLAGGERVLAGVDVAAAAGPLRAVERSFDVTVRGAALDLSFRPSKGEALVSAIEVLGGDR